MTNEQKAAILDDEAMWKEKIAHIAAQGDDNGMGRSEDLMARAALLRECAAMMRERGESGWTAQFKREYKGKTLAVVEAGPVGWYWYVDGSADYQAEIAPTLEAAQAAAVAWVDELEGCDA